MPYGQLHYPFENKELFEANFPADFVAEGLDQTRGWWVEAALRTSPTLTYPDLYTVCCTRVALSAWGWIWGGEGVAPPPTVWPRGCTGRAAGGWIAEDPPFIWFFGLWGLFWLGLRLGVGRGGEGEWGLDGGGWRGHY